MLKYLSQKLSRKLSLGFFDEFLLGVLREVYPAIWTPIFSFVILEDLLKIPTGIILGNLTKVYFRVFDLEIFPEIHT